MRMRYFLKFLKIIFAFSFFLAVLYSNCFAAANLPYIDKSKIRATIEPSKQGYGEIIVENPTEEERTMRLYLEDWYYLSGQDGAKEFVPSGTLPHSCASWINFSPAEFTIPAFGKQRVSYSIKVPTGATGGYYAALFFETQVAKLSPAPAPREAGIDLKVRIATLFYVEAAGTVERVGNISNLSVKKDPASNNLILGLDFNNSGNVDITCGGTFYLMDKEGIVAARGELGNVYTFAGDKANLRASWKKSLLPGKYNLVFTFDLGKAQEETGGTKIPLVTKEAEIEIDKQGNIIKIGELK